MIILYKTFFCVFYFHASAQWNHFEEFDVMKTWFYTFKLSNNALHFCACQLKIRGSFIVFINPFKDIQIEFLSF